MATLLDDCWQFLLNLRRVQIASSGATDLCAVMSRCDC